MKVILKRGWFAPGGRRFRKGINVGGWVEVPDHLREHLPSDAVVLPEDHVEPKAPREPETLSEAAALFGADPDRISVEMAEEVKEKADREESARKLQADLDADDDEPKVSGKRGPGRPRKTPKEN